MRLSALALAVTVQAATDPVEPHDVGFAETSRMLPEFAAVNHIVLADDVDGDGLP